MKRKPISTAERKRVYEKFGGKCAYCGQPITYKEMQVEHMEPLALGGADSMENYMPACRICNHYKHTLTVEKFREQIGLL
ncbi:HNH endonuclease signature motif containing protein, partial [uncultured Alistipes sp.]